MKLILKYFVLVFCFFVISAELQAQLVNLRPNANVFLNEGAVLQINGSVYLHSSSQMEQDGEGEIYVKGSWTNDGTFIPGTGIVTFIGGALSVIGGTTLTDFHKLVIFRDLAATFIQFQQGANIHELFVQMGRLQIENSNPLSFTIDSIGISANGTFEVENSGAQTHTIDVSGDIANEGAFNLRQSSAADVKFVGSENSIVSDAATTTAFDFNEIEIDKDSKQDTVSVLSDMFEPADPFLTLTRGVLHLAGGYTLTNTFFAPITSVIPSDAGLWIDNGTITVNTPDADFELSGKLHISDGIFNIAPSFGRNLFYHNGAEFTLENGSVIGERAFCRFPAEDAASIVFDISGGSLELGTTGQSTTSNRGVLDIGAAGSILNWSGGTIQLGRNSSVFAIGDYYVVCDSSVVSPGGQLKILATGGTNPQQEFKINTNQPIPELFVTADNNPQVELVTTGNDLDVLGDVTFTHRGLHLNTRTLTLGGNWNHEATNDADFVAGSGTVEFNGATSQTVGGTRNSTFGHLWVNKSDGTLEIDNPIVVVGAFRLLTNSLVDLNGTVLTMNEYSEFYTNDADEQSFSKVRCIVDSSAAGPVINRLLPDTTLAVGEFHNVLYPFGTPGVLSQFRFLYPPGSSFTGASLQLTAVPNEEPNVEKPNASLIKYWDIARAGTITPVAPGLNLQFYYDQSEVRGSEGNYQILHHRGTNWYINPGAGNFVSIGLNRATCEQLPLAYDYTGHWTAGEKDAARAIYYSIADGNYNQSGVWSKESHTGTPTADVPHLSADEIYIGNGNRISLTANPPAANKIIVKNTGILNCRTFVVGAAGNVVDTFQLQTGGRLEIGHNSGIVSLGSNGNIQATVRDFSEDAVYAYIGNNNQTIGSGLPLNVRGLIIDKDAYGNTVTMTQGIEIRDSLVINEGTLDVSTSLYRIQGETPGRTFIMRGGRFTIREDFPLNFTPPTFNAGEIDFFGAGTVWLPSSGSTPGVRQYHDLTFRGNKGYSFINFSSQDTIYIGGDFDISAQNFNTFDIPRFITSGSTVCFNGNQDQDIPRHGVRTTPARHLLNYYNLVLAGTGEKRLTGTLDHIILNDVLIQSPTCEFHLGTLDIEVQGSWTNLGGTFTHNGRDVTLNNPVALSTTTIISAGEPFDDLFISGSGTVSYDDNTFIEDDLSIDNGATFTSGGDTLYIFDDWFNNAGGTFLHGNGTVVFNGNIEQVVNNQETFYNLTVDKSANYLRTSAVGMGVIVENILNFNQGNLYASSRWVEVRNNCTRSGSGFVQDGPLRMLIPSGDSFDPKLFAIGNGVNDYRPITYTVHGSGGTAGLVEVSNNNFSWTDYNTNYPNSGLQWGSMVRRYWDVSIPGGSLFDLDSRTVDIEVGFVAGDVLGNPLNYEMRVWDGSGWNFPSTGTRTAATTQSLSGNDVTQIVVVGEPLTIVYYSIADGDWTDPATWSTSGYSGAASSTSPGANDSVRIGNGKTVTLTGNVTFNVNKAVIVEKAGPTNLGGMLKCENYNISGAGAFVLKDGGGLGIGSADGIVAAGAVGNIRTTIRTYNESGHNNGHFLYNGGTNQNTGSGLPSDIATLTVNNTGNTLTLSASVSLADSLHIESGTLDVSASNYNISLGGNWRNAGTFNEGSGAAEVTFTGDSLQYLHNTNNETFNRLKTNKGANKIQLTANGITISSLLTFDGGYIDARTGSFDVMIDGAAAVVRSSTGHVDGKLWMYIPTGANTVPYYIGAADKYTPSTMDITGAGGTAGWVAMTAYGTEHPSVSSSALVNYVDRYWVTEPDAVFDLGTREYDLTVTFIYPDDIKGGADPTTFVMKYYDGSSWNATGTGIPSTNTTTTGENVGVISGEFAVGVDAPPSVEYYSVGDGDWNDPNNWVNDGYGGSTSNGLYPGESAATDVVYIGDSKTITLNVNNLTVSSCTVEDAVSGGGRLNFGTNVLLGNQFVLKDNGTISVGAADGIQTSAASGCVQTTIRNYNHNNHNNGHFIYTDNAVTVGDGLSASIASLTVDVNPANTIQLENDLSISGDLLIQNGTLASNTNDIEIQGDWINNSDYSANNETVTFNGAADQNIGGDADTEFENLTLDKAAGNVILDTSILVQSLLHFNTNTLLVLNDNDLTIREGAAPATDITSTPGFSKDCMIQAEGSTSGGSIIKEYQTGAGVQRNFVFPIGTNTEYTPATINLTADFAAGAKCELQLISGLHPNRVSGQDNMIERYWSITTAGITNIQSVANTAYTFRYDNGDVVIGPEASYIPGVYSSSTGWEVNIGTSASINTATNEILAEQHLTLDGDWTAGLPQSFISGRIYYSRANNALWSQTNSWSNVSHAGPASLYAPGYFPYDTVIIAGSDNIQYDVASCTISELTIGGTTAGELSYRRSGGGYPLYKALTVLHNVTVNNNGEISESGPNGNRYDTLAVYGDLTNTSTTGVGIRLRNNDSRYTTLVFKGGGNSTVSGEGDWSPGRIHLDKDSLGAKLINQSQSFSTGIRNVVNGGNANSRYFIILGGTYRHENVQQVILDNDGGINPYAFPPNSGVEVPQGRVTFEDHVHGNSNTLFEVTGGRLDLATDYNEDFKYTTGTTVRITSGEIHVPGCFSNLLEASGVNLEIAGGVMTVMEQGSNRTGDLFGFGMKASSTFTMSGGTLIYANPTNGGWDYIVQAETYSITGGTVQFGIIGNYLSTWQSHSMGTSTPLWNISIMETRDNPWGVHCALVLLDAENYVLNDVIIETNGTLDLNCKNLSIGGDFINQGRFTPDGRGWDENTGSRKVTLNGTGDQAFYNLNTYNNSKSGGSMNNEPFYDLVIDKPSGNVICQNDRSYIYVRNKLEFNYDNTAVIDARTNNQFVEIDTRAGDLGQVNRYGLGHVDGALRMEVSNSPNQSVKFHIGESDDYTPATVDIGAGGGGSSGVIEAISYAGNPPNWAGRILSIDDTKNVERYWELNTRSGFSLGTKSFDLTLQFLNPDDIRGGANWTTFQQFDASGSPYIALPVGDVSDTTTESINNTAFRRYCIGEFTSVIYYSINSGNWTDGNNWSLTSYTGAPAGTYPQTAVDEAYIGNGKRITLLNTDGTQTIKSVKVEPYNGNYGELYVESNVWIDCVSFTLEDSCTLASAHSEGITALGINTGSVRASLVRNFGKGRYIYNSPNDAQSVGNGLPSNVLSLIIENTAPPGFDVVYLVNSSDQTIEDTLYLSSGQFDAGSGSNPIFINGDLVFDNDTLMTNTRPLEFSGTGTQYIVLNNPNGLNLYQLDLNKVDVPHNFVTVTGTEADAPIVIRNRLRFLDGNTGYLRSRPDHKIMIEPTASVLRIGANAYGHVDGILQKYVDAAADIELFEVGYEEIYAPATLQLDAAAGGTAGAIDAVNNEPVPLEPFVGNRMDPVVQVPRYWVLQAPTASSFSLGSRTADLTFSFPLAEKNRIDVANAVIRRKSIPTETPQWKERRFGELEWSVLVDTATVHLNLGAGTSRWEGIGEFYIGEKAQRTFYSRNTGAGPWLWDDNESWAFDQAETILVPAGEAPNWDWDLGAYEVEVRDSVVIDDNDFITLNVTPEISLIEIRENGTLTINDTRWLEASSVGASEFAIIDNGTLETKSLLGIEDETNNAVSIIRFPNASRTFEPTTNYIFSGTATQIAGPAFPTEINNLTVKNTGGAGSAFVSLIAGDLTINGDFSILSGDVRPKDATTNIILRGDFLIDGSYDATLDALGAPALSSLVLNGTGADNQLVSGTGTLLLHDLSMDRGAGAGIVLFNCDVELASAGVLDMQLDPANTNDQIIELGATADLIINNSNQNAVADYSNTPQRYIRTNLASGSLKRNILPNIQYTYPLGTSQYSPALFDGDNSGAAGFVAVRVSPGSSVDAATLEGHSGLPVDRTYDYIKRYWAIDEVSATIPGIWRFNYVDADIVGTETDMSYIGRWRPVKEGSPGAWDAYSGTIDAAGNFFETPNILASDFEGDWTIANEDSFIRIFYSLASGNWDDINSWTFDPSHTGIAATAYPQGPLDSAIIANAGAADHEISLNLPTVAVRGVAVGYPDSSGTLYCGQNIITGRYFSMQNLSTLGVGSPDGITLAGATGNIQTDNRTYYPALGNTSFEYTGNADQVIGDGLPENNIHNFILSNTGGTLTIDRNIRVHNNLIINSGVLDLQTFTMNNPNILATGDFLLDDAARIRIGGSNSTLDAVDNYLNYTIHDNSIVEFYGADQYISHTPANLSPNLYGFGYVELSQAGTKYVDSPLLIRMNLNNIGGSSLVNEVGVDALMIKNGLLNNSNIHNDGTIEIGH